MKSRIASQQRSEERTRALLDERDLKISKLSSIIADRDVSIKDRDMQIVNLEKLRETIAHRDREIEEIKPVLEVAEKLKLDIAAVRAEVARKDSEIKEFTK